MALHVTSIGPVEAEVELADGNIVHATVLAFRWSDAAPDEILAYLARVKARHPNTLDWLAPDDIQRFK